MSKRNSIYRILAQFKFRFPKEVIFIGVIADSDELEPKLKKAREVVGSSTPIGMVYRGTNYVNYNGEWIQYREYQERKRVEAIPAWRRKYEGVQKSDGRYYREPRDFTDRDSIRQMRRQHDQRARNGRV